MNIDRAREIQDAEAIDALCDGEVFETDIELEEERAAVTEACNYLQCVKEERVTDCVSATYDHHNDRCELHILPGQFFRMYEHLPLTREYHKGTNNWCFSVMIENVKVYCLEKRT